MVRRMGDTFLDFYEKSQPSMAETKNAGSSGLGLDRSRALSRSPLHHGAVRRHSHHFVSKYRSLSREELLASLRESGFEQIRWLMPHESGFYQPLVWARKRAK
jgi:hypothetical protein